jgi:hypothetical protein
MFEKKACKKQGSSAEKVSGGGSTATKMLCVAACV